MLFHQNTPLQLSLFPAAESARRAFLLCLSAAVAITVVQLTVTLMFAKGDTLRARYESLVVFDGMWFRSIAFDGYKSAPLPLKYVVQDQSNVAFFPAFPLTARAVHFLTRLPQKPSLLLAAELACVGFWTYFFLLCRRWRISKGAAFTAALAIAAYPSSYYMLAGYSEPLFLFSCTGFFYWCTHESKHAWLIAGAHGLVMTASRAAGVPLAILPVVLFLLTSKGLRRPFSDLRPWLTSAIAGLGVGMFFAYCQWRFGAWDLYSQTQRVGWGNSFHFARMFDVTLYRFFPISLHPLDTFAVSRNVLPYSALALSLICITDLAFTRFKHGFRERFVLYMSAVTIFGLSLNGIGVVAMVRYTLPVHILLILAALHLASKKNLPSGFHAAAQVIVPVLTILSAGLQFQLIQTFTAGSWVA